MSFSSSAVISTNGLYRYVLRRSWDAGPSCMFVMLNPSKADAESDDPTIRRCIGFAKSWNYSSLTVCNLYALRSTDPRFLWEHDDPVGPDNDGHLLIEAGLADLIVLAWGAAGERNSRAEDVKQMLAGAQIRHLGLTASGEPRHPLYLSRSLVPEPFVL